MAAFTSAEMSHPEGAPVARRFVPVGSRLVHYLRAGDGPPVVLIHASPYNATAWLAGMRQWSRRFTCYALDNPGFGESDPLPVERMDVMGLTVATAETIRALGLVRCIVIGSHTGAAVALELAVQYPDLVAGVVLEGAPLFTDEEVSTWFAGDYFAPLKISPHGEHLTWAWTRVRDADQWFPWVRRLPQHRYADARGSAEKLHSDVMDYYLCAEHFITAYRSAVHYGAQCERSLRALETPALVTASSADLMFEHMERLPPLKPQHRVRKLGPEPQAFFDAVEEALIGFSADLADAPADAPQWPAADGIGKQFLDLAGGRMMVRYAGSQDAEPILLLHDVPGTSRDLEPLLAALGGHAFAVAIDLPGCGDSDPLGRDDPDLDAFAARIVETLDGLGLSRVALHGTGIGATLAIAVGERAPDRVSRIALDGVLLPDAAERADLLAHLAPRVAIKANGSHWYEAWLMLRDGLVASPWYDGSRAALRWPGEEQEAAILHRRTVELMKQWSSYHRVVEATLAYDAAAAIHRNAASMLAIDDPADRYRRYFPQLRRIAPDMPLVPHGEANILAAALLGAAA